MVQIPKKPLPGQRQPVSQLILGCDNKDTAEDGAPVWDHWLAVGGTAFDTAYVYGGGLHEKALGGWMRSRGLGTSLTVVVKGAHTPHCTPEALSRQLTESLDRLQLDHAPVYIMHRDNPDVPVGEFVDVLNREQQAGRIGVFGGSNWSLSRFDAANSYARLSNLSRMSILNNNLSLAVMERPVWPGCVTSNTPETLAWLRRSGAVHFSWSAQARGYFLAAHLRDRLPEDTRPETCFGSAANAERRRRAEAVADERGVSANAVALAWVLGQPFPSYALVGPRTVEEIDLSLAAVTVALSAEDVAWLNLETDRA